MAEKTVGHRVLMENEGLSLYSNLYRDWKQACLANGRPMEITSSEFEILILDSNGECLNTASVRSWDNCGWVWPGQYTAWQPSKATNIEKVKSVHVMWGHGVGLALLHTKCGRTQSWMCCLHKRTGSDLQSLRKIFLWPVIKWRHSEISCI